MTPKVFRGAVRFALALGAPAAIAMATAATTVSAQQATTSGTVRGFVTGPDGAPIQGVTVVATNNETGVRRGTQTDASGRYVIPFLDPGPYTFRAQFIGYRAVEKPGYRIGLGQVEKIDFQLQTAATTLATQRVVAEATPLIEPAKTSSSTRIDQKQIVELPTNGRNFKDLVKLAPGVSDLGSPGSGGGQSIGGGRSGASNILMDGTNNNEAFFGGDARGGDRAPFSYSIEAIKEIQVITSATDVELGSFTGGAVNAVTKSGTNKFEGATFGYLRKDAIGNVKLTGNDFFNRPPTDFQKAQYGFALGGPIIKDKAHFYVTLDRQTASDPRLVFVGPNTDAGVRASGINADTLANFLRIAKEKYGYDLSHEVGNFVTNTDQKAVFGRVDWQISNAHHFTLRDNYVDVNLTQDRLFVSPTSQDLLSSAGNNTDKSNSLVGSLTSVFGGMTNEFRAQYANEHKPRPANPTGGYGIPLPQVFINNIRSVLSDGSTFGTAITFGADPVLHANDIKTRTTELIDNVRFTRGAHSFKVGGNYTNTWAFDRFGQNSLGSFSFNSITDFENNNPASFTRALPYPGKSQIDDANFTVQEFAAYAQDEWQATPRFFLQYGLRYDYTRVPTKASGNPDLQLTFPALDVSFMPTDNNNVSPRVGFTFDPMADGRTIVRGASSLVYGRNPFVVYSNVFANSGRSQTTLSCSGGATPLLDPASYASDPSTIPTSCLAGSGAAPAAPSVNVFAKDYKQAYAFKNNLAVDRLITDNWRITIEGIVGTIRDNFLVQDDNLVTTPAFFIEGGMPVFQDPTTISATGATNFAFSRRDSRFRNVLVHRSIGSTLIRQGVLQLNGRLPHGTLYAAYTYDRTRDNGSLSCCITSTMYNSGFTAGNPNDYNDQWGPSDFQRTHTFTMAPNIDLPFGFKVAGIFTYRSGVPWTPAYGSDVNGDGVFGNDRLYIPTRTEVENYSFFGATADAQARQRALFENKIESVACLREHRGQFATRGMCRNPYITTLDARVSKKFATLRGQNVELQADFFNLLNGINKNYGRYDQVATADTRLLSTRGFNQATKQFQYQVNPTFGTSTPANLFALNQFQTQLGIRYNF